MRATYIFSIAFGAFSLLPGASPTAELAVSKPGSKSSIFARDASPSNPDSISAGDGGPANPEDEYFAGYDGEATRPFKYYIMDMRKALRKATKRASDLGVQLSQTSG